MKFEHTEVMNFENAIRGMRNPLESWDKSDSEYIDIESEEGIELQSKGIYYKIGKNDLILMQKLIKAGSEHRKFMRQIFVSVDITAPSYFFAELDTYKIGVVRNSTSMQHKGVSHRYTIDDFEVDENIKEVLRVWEQTLDTLNMIRDKYLDTKDYKYFRLIRQLMPMGYLYTSTITMNYENLFAMVHQRKGHKLSEWSKSFIDWARSLPYAQELIFLDEKCEQK